MRRQTEAACSNLAFFISSSTIALSASADLGSCLALACSSTVNALSSSCWVARNCAYTRKGYDVSESCDWPLRYPSKSDRAFSRSPCSQCHRASSVSTSVPSCNALARSISGRALAQLRSPMYRAVNAIRFIRSLGFVRAITSRRSMANRLLPAAASSDSHMSTNRASEAAYRSLSLASFSASSASPLLTSATKASLMAPTSLGRSRRA